MQTKATMVPYTVEEEEITTSTWLLETLGVENASQAAVKLSGITVLCLIISVVAVLVLDAHFVARMKGSAETHVGADIMQDESQDNQSDSKHHDTTKMIDSELGVEMAGSESIGAMRGYLPPSIFGDKSYHSVSASKVIDPGADGRDLDFVDPSHQITESPKHSRRLSWGTATERVFRV